jgi:hypothetical protein
MIVLSSENVDESPVGANLPGIAWHALLTGSPITDGALSDDTPDGLGTAAAGVSGEASRSDHIHPMPDYTDVGADAAGAAQAVADTLGSAALANTGDFEAAGAVSAHTGDTTAAHAASAISVGTLNGNLSAVSGTDVEQAIQAVDNLSLGGTVDVVSNVATSTLLGRTTAGSGDSEELSASAVRTLLGLVIGTNVQAYDAELAALAGTTSAADKLPYYSGSGTATTTDLTSFARTLLDDTTAAAARTTIGAGNPGFGTGADGDVTIAADTTITGDFYTGSGPKHYRNLTVNSGVTLTVRGFVYVAGTLTNNGTIAHDGPSAVANIAGTGVNAPGTGTFNTGGGNGGSAANPTTNPSGGSIVALGGAGGAGGTGPSGAGGAAAVNATVTSFTEAAMKYNPAMLEQGFVFSRNSNSLILVGAGRSGGGGGGDGTAGGGGGCGGGFLFVKARYVTGSGTIRANGGNGGVPAGGNRGGGGGGGGGLVVLWTTSSSHTMTLTATAGTGGTGTGTGTAGSNGAAGFTLEVLG